MSLPLLLYVDRVLPRFPVHFHLLFVHIHRSQIIALYYKPPPRKEQHIFTLTLLTMATLTQHRSPNPQAASTSTTPQTNNANTSFTPEMRDRQARGKNPFSDWQGVGERKEDYHDRERKDLAMAVLDSPEKLLMYAQANDDVSSSSSPIICGSVVGSEK